MSHENSRATEEKRERGDGDAAQPKPDSVGKTSSFDRRVLSIIRVSRHRLHHHASLSKSNRAR